MAGEIVHYEIGAEDSDRAQAFWSGLFGWEFGPGMPEMDYRMAQISDTAGAAIFHAEKPQGYPNVYHAVDDIDASAAKVRELGGEAGDKIAGAGSRLVRRVQGHGGERVPPLAAGLVGRAVAPGRRAPTIVSRS